MTRILVACLPFAGHVGPMTAVSAELVRRGHDVVAYTGVKYRGRFESAGAQWLPWSRAQDFDDADLAATFPRVGDGKGLRGAKANSEEVLFGTAPGQAADIRAAAEDHPFDLIVADHLAFGAALAGEGLGMPWASVAVTPLGLTSEDLPPPGLRLWPATGRVGRLRDALLWRAVGPLHRLLVRPQVNRIRAAAGLEPTSLPLVDSLHSPRLVLAQGVPGLEYPRGDLPAHVRFVGRLAPPPGSQPRLPSWWPDLLTARAEGRPVVHVTQGTLDVDPDDLLQPAIVGLAAARPLLVCATGGAPASTLGPLPANVRIAPFLPHDLLLPLVDIMVTNGGWGGVLAAVEAGVPLVVAAGSLDKPEVARRVAWSGVGLDLRTGKPRPHRVRRAVLRALDDPQLRQRARELGAALTAAGGAHTAAALVEQLLPDDDA